MTQVAEQSRTRRRECDTQDYDLKVSSYDQVASMLIALLVLVGAVVLLLFLLWLTSTLFAKQTAIPVTLAEVSGGQGGVSTEGLQLDAPEAEEMAQELEIEEPQIEETLANVVDAIAQRLADLTDPTLTEDMESGGPTASTGTGDAPSLGESGGQRNCAVLSARGRKPPCAARAAICRSRGRGYPKDPLWGPSVQRGIRVLCYGADSAIASDAIERGRVAH